MDWCMSFVVFERKNGKFSVLQPCFGMPGGVDLLMSYFISVLFVLFVDVLNYWLSAFEGKVEPGGVTALQRYN